MKKKKLDFSQKALAVVEQAVGGKLKNKKKIKPKRNKIKKR